MLTRKSLLFVTLTKKNRQAYKRKKRYHMGNAYKKKLTICTAYKKKNWLAAPCAYKRRKRKMLTRRKIYHTTIKSV